MKTFESVASLKLASLREGQQVRTRAQITDNDGLGVMFNIVTSATPSGDDIFELVNGNYAVTAKGETRLNGAQPQMFDGVSWINI